jgi:hypothetical protein
MSHLRNYLIPLQKEMEYHRIVVPSLFPTNNKVLVWGRHSRSHNVRQIHEMVRICSLIKPLPYPDKYRWDWEGCHLKSKRVGYRWFMNRWNKSVLGLKKPPRAGTHTVIELHTLMDGRIHVHVHSVRARLTDEDGVSCKALVDGLTHAGFFPDDRREFVAGVTQSQEKLSR